MNKKSLKQLTAMARGYKEMGELNLHIANNSLGLEEEGWRLHEMGAKKTENRAK